MAKLKKIHRVILIGVLVIGAFIAGAILNRSDAGMSPTQGKDLALGGAPADSEQEPDLSSSPPGSVFISRARRDTIGIESAPVGSESASHVFRFPGRVAAIETRTYILNAAVDGWITSAAPTPTGSYVRKDEALASYYSPDFQAAAQSLFFVLNAMDQFQTTSDVTAARKEQIAQFNLDVKKFQLDLRKLGVSDAQIERMSKERRWTENVELVSPVDGYILARNITEGLRFAQGTELFRIADLSRVWIVADVYENEARYVKPGLAASIPLPDQTGPLRATVSKLLPGFDPSTRTLKVRLEADNRGLALRPDMYVDVDLPVNLPSALTIPSDAILFAGLRSMVYVDAGEGVFVPRTVELGWRLGDRVEIKSGLEPGERIVVAGNFFVDSESRLQNPVQGASGSVEKRENFTP